MHSLEQHAHRLNILHIRRLYCSYNRIVSAIRAIVPLHFILGIKVSSADYVEAGTPADLSREAHEEAERRAVRTRRGNSAVGGRRLSEVSGGDYEQTGYDTHAYIPTRRRVY